MTSDFTPTVPTDVSATLALLQRQAADNGVPADVADSPLKTLEWLLADRANLQGVCWQAAALCDRLGLHHCGIGAGGVTPAEASALALSARAAALGGTKELPLLTDAEVIHRATVEDR